MSGHSHSSNVAGRKDKQNKIKSRLFSRFAKEIATSVKQSGTQNNPTLNSIIAKAKSYDMPKASIDRALAIGSGTLTSDTQYELTYEVIKSGVAIIIKATTDNKNRTVAEINSVLKKHNTSLATQNSALRLFTRTGYIHILSNDMDNIMTQCIDIDGVEDIQDNIVLCDPTRFFDVLNLIRDNLPVSEEDSEVKYIATTSIEHNDSVQSLIDALEDIDDIDEVITNMI